MEARGDGAGDVAGTGNMSGAPPVTVYDSKVTARCTNPGYPGPMQPKPPLSNLTVQELRARARRFREMGATARTLVVWEGLLKLAERFDAMADARVKELEPD